MIDAVNITKNRGRGNSAREHATDRLFWHELSGIFSLAIIPTLYCNLRCNHCNVKELLTDKEDACFTPERLGKFVVRYIKAYPHKRMDFLFIGGEIFLLEERLKSLIHTVYPVSNAIVVTTNLSQLPEDREILRLIDDFQVSVDGLRQEHDSQRNCEGLFQRIYQNLGIMKEMGIVDRINVACCIDQYADKISFDYMVKFKTMLSLVGVDWTRISLGNANPTTPSSCFSEKVKSSMRTPCRYTVPCCSWRFMQSICVSPSGDLWTHYYGVNKKDHWLGTLESDIEDIRSNYVKAIEHSPFVQDRTCYDCEALSDCWGLHCYAKWKFTEEPRPSEFCTRQKMIELRNMNIANDHYVYPSITGVTFNS